VLRLVAAFLCRDLSRHKQGEENNGCQKYVWRRDRPWFFGDKSPKEKAVTSHRTPNAGDERCWP
jgi:hypothetical protein